MTTLQHTMTDTLRTCDAGPLIDRCLCVRNSLSYLLPRDDVHAQHDLGEGALVDHFAHQVAAHAFSVRKVSQQVTGDLSEAGRRCLLQLPRVSHAPIQR